MPPRHSAMQSHHQSTGPSRSWPCGVPVAALRAEIPCYTLHMAPNEAQWCADHV